MLMKHILAHYFATDEGAWPGWYRGVTLLYAGEVAVNHCAPDAKQSALLDAGTTSRESVMRCAHIHCWHTDDKFSKHAFMCGRYTPEDARDLDLEVVSDYCMAMSFRSLDDLAPAAAPLLGSATAPSRRTAGKAAAPADGSGRDAAIVRAAADLGSRIDDPAGAPGAVAV
jgi:hypothetical protein